MNWPYCQGHVECHESHTRQYSRAGTGYGAPWVVYITLNPRRDVGGWGIRLCHAHALIRFGVA